MKSCVGEGTVAKGVGPTVCQRTKQPYDEDIGMGQSQRKEGRKERSGQATSTTYHK